MLQEFTTTTAAAFRRFVFGDHCLNRFGAQPGLPLNFRDELRVDTLGG
jgi:hypothetical protein